jgi:nicotinamidase-related amidase
LRSKENPRTDRINSIEFAICQTHSDIRQNFTMLASGLMLLLSSLSLGLAQQNASAPGYDNYPTSIPSTVTNNSFSFGKHYAVLNLDLIDALVDSVSDSPEGQSFINNTAHWIDAVHARNPPPLSIFTRIFFTNLHRPELGPKSGMRVNDGMLGTANSSETQIYSAFHVNETAGDTVLQKTRYYAGGDNALEQILRAQQIDTVIISGIRTSGVVLTTAYRLFDIDYEV